MIVLVPRPCQTLIATMAGIAQNGSEIQRCGGMPRPIRIWFSRPPVGA